MTQHIRFNVPETTRDYHTRLRSSIVSLVTECQESEQRQDISILDVGCGRGELIPELQATGAHVSGVDMEPQCVAMSSKYADIKQGSIYEIEQLYGREQFDIVIASHILEHLESPKHGVESLAAVSKKRLILAVPNLAEMRNLRWRIRDPGYVNRGHQVGWDAPHFNTFLVYACGLTVEKWQPDRVYLPRRLQSVAKLMGVTRRLQDNWLPSWFPLQSHSLIVLCRK
ncbi:MAG: class I SAM-dependent methyltransferase [Caldilineaceae bacterium]|nr:class I SAM-dependent methyltransferase [Caldilineaceae bacterium]